MKPDETTTSAPSEPPDPDLPRGPGSVLGSVEAGQLLAAAVTLLALLTVALAVNVESLNRLDTALADWGYEATYGHDALTTWWIGVAAYGQPMVLRVTLVLIGLGLAWKRRRALAVWLIGISVAENVIAPLAKHLLNRSRPGWLEPIAVERSLSFPSGHAAAAGMFTSAVILLAFAIMRPGWSRKLVLTSAGLIGLVISVDRIFLGVHYLSDVIGGNLLGMAITLAGWLLMLRIVRDPHGHGRNQQS